MSHAKVFSCSINPSHDIKIVHRVLAQVRCLLACFVLRYARHLCAHSSKSSTAILKYPSGQNVGIISFVSIIGSALSSSTSLKHVAMSTDIRPYNEAWITFPWFVAQELVRANGNIEWNLTLKEVGRQIQFNMYILILHHCFLLGRTVLGQCVIELFVRGKKVFSATTFPMGAYKGDTPALLLLRSTCFTTLS